MNHTQENYEEALVQNIRDLGLEVQVAGTALENEDSPIDGKQTQTHSAEASSPTPLALWGYSCGGGGAALHPRLKQVRTKKPSRLPPSSFLTSDGYPQAIQNDIAIDSLGAITSEDQLVLVLIGIPGCGKSTVAKLFVNDDDSSLRWRSSSRHWTVACQDELGNREEVIAVAKSALESGRSVVIDRCNFDSSQREHWITLARSMADRKISVFGFVLPHYNDVEVCSQRAFARGDDGVHKPGTNWSKICQCIKKQFRLPSAKEGFDGILNSACVDDTNFIVDILINLP